MLHEAGATRMEAVFRALLATVLPEQGAQAALRVASACAQDPFSRGIVALADAWVARRDGAPDAETRVKTALEQAPPGALASGLVRELSAP